MLEAFVIFYVIFVLIWTLYLIVMYFDSNLNFSSRQFWMWTGIAVLWPLFLIINLVKGVWRGIIYILK